MKLEVFYHISGNRKVLYPMIAEGMKEYFCFLCNKKEDEYVAFEIEFANLRVDQYSDGYTFFILPTSFNLSSSCIKYCVCLNCLTKNDYLVSKKPINDKIKNDINKQIKKNKKVVKKQLRARRIIMWESYLYKTKYTTKTILEKREVLFEKTKIDLSWLYNNSDFIISVNRHAVNT